MRLMRFSALALGTAALVVLAAHGQPPPGGGFKGDKGKGAKAPNVNSERLLDDLKLSDGQRRKARDLLRAHDDKMKAAAKQARDELLAQMKDVLDAGEYATFKDELAQVPLLPTIPANLRTVAADDLLERLMGFDADGDGKVTRAELPERMHALVEQGDRNGDGALDRDEARRLSERGNGPPGPGNGKGVPKGRP